MLKNLVYIFFFVFVINTAAQEDSLHIQKDSTYIYGDYMIFRGDTLTITLDEVHLLKKLKFKSNYDRRYYFWFRKKVLRAYPYAKLAQDRLSVINERLNGIQSKHKRKRYTKRLQRYFEKEFTEQLKKLTRTEGRVLIKLIYRQTGETTYNMVKSLRNSWKATWYQSTAKLFKLSLKSEYHPETVYEDYLIEDILQRAFNDLILERQEPKIQIDYDKLYSRRSDYIEIEKKKK